MRYRVAKCRARNTRDCDLQSLVLCHCPPARPWTSPQCTASRRLHLLVALGRPPAVVCLAQSTLRFSSVAEYPVPELPLATATDTAALDGRVVLLLRGCYASAVRILGLPICSAEHLTTLVSSSSGSARSLGPQTNAPLRFPTGLENTQACLRAPSSLLVREASDTR